MLGAEGPKGQRKSMSLAADSRLTAPGLCRAGGYWTSESNIFSMSWQRVGVGGLGAHRGSHPGWEMEHDGGGGRVGRVRDHLSNERGLMESTTPLGLI